MNKINKVPYYDFKLLQMIDPEQFDTNNAALVAKLDEIVDYVNALSSIIDNNSGADKIGSTPINGITGTTIQAQLEGIRNMIDVIQLGQIADGTITNAKLAPDAKIGSLATLNTTNKSSVVAAINEMITTLNNIDVTEDILAATGNLSELTTTDKTTLVGAINEVDGDIGIKGNLLTTNKTTLVGAVNELFTNANNGKASIATAIGDDASASDTFSVLTSKLTTQKRSNQKKIANLTAFADVYDRVTGAQDVIYDIFEDDNEYSAGKLDTVKTRTNTALSIGNTVLTGKVDNATAFSVGQEITLFDDVNMEDVLVTRAEPLISNTTIDRSTPTAVVGAAYDTSGNGGRKLVKLSNGWLVCATTDTADSNVGKMYISKDNGVTWTFLTKISANQGAGGRIALASNGCIVYVISVWSVSIGFVKIDPTQTVAASIAPPQYVDQSQNDMQGCSLAIDSSGNLHAAWSSKNATYPNSFNIRYSKGVVDGSGTVTWAAPTQLTTLNTSGQDHKTPCIVMGADGYPRVFYTWETVTQNNIRVLNYNGSAWNLVVVYSGASYTQNNPCAVVDSTGAIHVVWHGKDSTDTTVNNIRYSKSTDGGTTWAAPAKLTSGNTYHQYFASIAVDTNNSLYVMWAGYINVNEPNLRKIIYTSAWSAITTLTNYTSSGGISNVSLCSSCLDFTDPLCIYNDNPSISVKFRGVFTAATTINHLETTALTKAFKQYATVCRSSVSVDTANHKMKFGGWEHSITYDRSAGVNVSTSPTMVNQNSCSRISNGWLVACLGTSSNTLTFYKSTDNGATWSVICTCSGWGNVDNPEYSAYFFKGTTVYVFGFVSSANRYGFVKFDAATQTNVNISTSVVLLPVMINIGAGSSLYVEDDGTIHAVQSSAIQYSAAYDLLYTKSTDGGTTWSAYEKVTTSNTSGAICQWPTIMAKDGKPSIVGVWYESSNSLYRVMCFSKSFTTQEYVNATWMPTTWGNKIIFQPTANNYNQSRVHSIYSDGVWHISWVGTDASSSYPGLRYAKSSDKGASWTVVRVYDATTTSNYSYESSIGVGKNEKAFIAVSKGYADSSISVNIWVYQNLDGAISATQYTNYSSTQGDATYVAVVHGLSDFTSPPVIYRDNQISRTVFNGTFVTNSISKISTEVARYNIAPRTGSTGEVVAWVEHDGVNTPVNFTVTITEV